MDPSFDSHQKKSCHLKKSGVLPEVMSPKSCAELDL